MDLIRIRGARTHNLKNIDLDIPRNKLVVFTGLSGSGKSSLAFDTLYAEGQRRYVESLSSYARQFLSVMEKPDVDLIDGLSPAISIEQKTISHNPRSTVGTITEIYDYLRLLYARVGVPCCPEHGILLDAQTVSQIVDNILNNFADKKIALLSPIVKSKKGEYKNLLNDLMQEGFLKIRLDGEIIDLYDFLEKDINLDAKVLHKVELVIDRLNVNESNKERLAESVELATQRGNGVLIIASLDGSFPEQIFSSKFACPICGYSIMEMEPRMFSFNNSIGACKCCDGLGIKYKFSEEKLILDENLSLQEGAVRSCDSKNFYYYSLLKALAEHYKIDLKTPFFQLPDSFKHVLFYGSGHDKIKFRYMTMTGKIMEYIKPFEGLIANMERRYKETSSALMREELENYLVAKECEECHGARIRKEARNVFINGKNIFDVTSMAISDALAFIKSVTLSGNKAQIAEKILKEIENRLQFLIDVGLDYLTLGRSGLTLSGGEAQRIRLASQIGSGLTGVMYILDEPTIGLHQRDNERLLKSLGHLRDLGNSVIVVEHDSDTMKAADYLVDVGLMAGEKGGHIVASGTYDEVLKSPESLTAKYLRGDLKIEIPKKTKQVDFQKMIHLEKATKNNLKDLTVDFPIGLLTCVTGVSGSGKSSLVDDTLYPLASTAVLTHFRKMTNGYAKISGIEDIERVILIDQSPIGRTPRSIPATYTGIFTKIRELFAATSEAKARGYREGRFSFNIKGGQCAACEGNGLIKVEMHFLSDIYVTCDACHGARYNRETMEIKYKGKNIAEVLNMTVDEACEFFAAIPSIFDKLKILQDVGLGYLRLGQSSTTLSGGEAQRIKLSTELARRDDGKNLYILDEPTTGLHFHDVKHLLEILHRLRDKGNTLVIIEHNLDVIKTADWIIDLGPEGGTGGGNIIATGKLKDIINSPKSYTGKFLAQIS